ncbi:winged helix-turn-helix transcriptional regulator [Sediminispirochaeta smaragdinae]|jgi:DNA-binding HxlR family transcriptional regulator|uniref:Transcriptional regulator, HxlR family n=1 Tax=Sediminispirochaeta smaragdinae (strain DSM 11293 / JCM 15392 / SEBR 4228) TaxID=573413 RepID=E1R9V4_SEDSS|nr:helix-turn-helix domain-containing protein [Sediminispirochaeta smaragdinae]ADK83273.1 transcriptional regulator, HxlR family [Sediminispirochaeta smaragdinae DSM 11293]
MTYDEFLQAVKTNTLPEISREHPVTQALVMLQGKWKNHILYELLCHGRMRFGEIKKLVPEITNTMLAATLRELESYGLIHRIQYNEIPPHVEYYLTDKGKDLMPVYYEIFKWAYMHLNDSHAKEPGNT